MSDVENPETKRSEQPTRQRPSWHRRKDVLDIPSMIDDFFHSRVRVNEGGVSRYIKSFEVIIHHLWLKETAGSRRAGKLLTRYMNFAASQGSSGGIEVRIVPDPPEDKQGE
jgi:hypothetical protein